MAVLRRWYVAIALFIALILDGVLGKLFQGWLFHGTYGAACWISLVGICLIALCDDQNVNNIWLSLGIGILADGYYLGFFGVYTVAFPLICFLVEKIARYLPEVFWSRLVVCLLAYLAVNFYLYLIFSIVGVISLPISSLFKGMLLGLITSFILTLLTYSFWTKLVEKHPFLVHQTQY